MRPVAWSFSTVLQPWLLPLSSAASASGAAGLSRRRMSRCSRYSYPIPPRIAAIATNNSQRVPRMEMTPLYRAMLTETPIYAADPADPHSRHRRHVREGIQRAHGRAFLQGDAYRRHAASRPLPP